MANTTRASLQEMYNKNPKEAKKWMKKLHFDVKNNEVYSKQENRKKTLENSVRATNPENK